MKKLMLLLWLVSTISLAEKEYEAPPTFLKDGKITLKLKNGKKHKFDSNKWKIVERVKHKKQIRKPAACNISPVIEYVDVEIEVEKIVEKEVPVTVYKFKPNRLSLVLGYGPIGLETNVTGEIQQRFDIREKLGPIIGARYTRQFDAKWSVGFEYLTSHTGALSVGWGW